MLIQLLYFLLALLTQVSFMVCLDFAYNDGHLLGNYYKWLLKYETKAWSKPMGLCIYCQSMHIAVYSAPFLWYFGMLHWSLILPYLVISHLLLRLILRILS